MSTYEKIKNDNKIKQLIKSADESLKNIGFTEHSLAHVTLVMNRAVDILTTLGYDDKTIDMVKVASYMHDIGNAINRNQHSISGGAFALQYLLSLNIPIDECVSISSAIGCHDESSASPNKAIVSPIAAALIIADKSDVRRSRVRKQNLSEFDNHDKVNYSAINSKLTVDAKHKKITLEIELDKHYSNTLSFYEIFISRMIYCRTAANYLNCDFELILNESE